jgi:hypothetical protein
LKEASGPEGENIVSHDVVKSIQDECCWEVHGEFLAVMFQPFFKSSNAMVYVDELEYIDTASVV